MPGPRPLWPYVRRIHAYDIAGKAPGEHIGLPSPTVTMVLPLGDPLDLSMPGLGRRRLASCVAGLHDGPATIHHRGTQRGVQLELAALALPALFGVGAADLAGIAVDLADLVGDAEARRLGDRLAGAADWGERVAVTHGYLAWRLRGAADTARPRAEVVRAWNLLARSHGTAAIAAVAADVGWSRRHLGQQFALAVGTTPKGAARLLRFHRSVTMIAAGQPPAVTAARCGFADQAHLTREWRRMAGTTPTRWPQVDELANVQDGGRGRLRGSPA